MKTILYNPIFINPQAYYVFPRLTRYLQPDNESTSEPANYIGTIEVKVIAYGDTTLKRTYTNTDSIDLSEFKNTWIRISLFTKVGSCVLGEWKIGNMESDLPYIDPEVLASLKAVVIVGNKTNNDSDRAIVKNLVDPDNPFVISNAAYEGMSGYNGYPVVFGANKTWANESNGYVTSITSNTIHITNVLNAGNALLYSYVKYNGNLQNIKEIPPFKIEIKGLEGRSKFIYKYLATSDATKETNLYLENGTHELPKSFLPTEALIKNAVVGFSISPIKEGVTNFLSNITIKVLPEYEGAFVTDGIDDLITSTKTVQEMGITDEVTVVSMIHQIDKPSNFITTNNIRTSGSVVGRNAISLTDKTGIYGWYKDNIQGSTINVINNILGDKADYTASASSNTNLSSKFSVVGYISNDSIVETSQVAWYWTIIANKVLTTDQINQVIAYFNLDRTLNPDILCNTIKQGITNENHAEFGDKLIDYSGNGRDIQLNNLAWDGDSGIGKYNYPNWKVTATIANTYSTIVNYPTVNGTYSINVNGVSELMQSIGLHLEIKYTTSTGIIYNDIKQDGVYSYILPDGATDLTLRFGGIPGIVNEPCNITITQIPSHAGALCLDGVNDFGKVTGMSVYKDYTFIIDRQIIFIGDTAGVVASKSEDSADATKHGAFIFEYLGAPDKISTWSFYKDNGQVANTDFTRGISYQSKYSYNGKDLTVGTSKDSDKLWLGTIRDNDSRFFNGAIYSLMSFPYSMSEFLIERQLKKHKLGTLYPDMVEFRPIIKHDDRITAIKYYHIKGSSWIDLKPGDYISVGSKISITTNLKSPYTIANVVSSSLTDIKVVPSAGGGNAYDILGYVTDKSPQKINLTIEQDENYVKWNPVINSNIEYKNALYYTVTNGVWTRINSGDYINIKERIAIAIFPNGIDELVSVTSSDLNNISVVSINNNGEFYYFLANLTSNSPQNINITIDEYIRYEDIDFTNCYPGVPRIYVNDKIVTWGNKLKVGDEFTFYGNVNILPEMYNVLVKALYNGEEMVYGSIGTISKSMVFTSFKTYLLDNNEPKCILSPRLLRIPNSSYKILGHIPDISGHGNHGKINNSAYAGASGANGYLQNFSEWTKASGVSSTDSVISSSNNLVAANGWIAYVTSGTVIPTFKVEISGIPVNGNLRFEGSDQTLVNGVNTIQGITTTKVTGFYISSGYDNDWSNLKIEQIGEYEGAYCFDGVDDFVTIPTTVGGKQVLMKVNWDSPNASILYDQIGYNNEFAIYNGTNDSDGNPIPAYQGRNNGQTYIDGILNSNIKASELRAITHNITITNELSSGANKTYPIIGSSKSNAYFVNMALYDFMLFDEISTDDKILELNEYVGIEGNTE